MNFTNRLAGLIVTGALLVACGGATPAVNETEATAVVEASTESASAETEPQEPTTEDASSENTSTEDSSTEESASDDSSTEESASDDSSTEEESSDESSNEENATEESAATSSQDSSTNDTGSEAPPTAGGGATIDESEVPELPTLGDNAVTTDSGLKYEDVVDGEGEEAKSGDIVTVHYTGYLEDGTVFDSSLTDGNPFQVSLGASRVIKGWEEGLIGMKIGAQRTLVIPPELAYGEESRGNIPANSTLVFSVEVLDIQKQSVPAEVSEYTTDDSGVEFAILQEGDGPEAETGDIVRFDYNAWIEESQILFDSSSQAGRPASLPLGQSGLPGLDFGIEGMKSGETRQIRIPPELAYGEDGAGDVIPPNATLIFEIRLLELKISPKLSQVDEADYETTDSGLQYAILTESDGDEVKSGDGVSVHYSGWLEDGTLFDSSIPRDTPFTFVVGAGDVIAGWDEGIEGMKVGEKRQLRIPGELGYGATGSPPRIPPNATLIFDVEVIAIDSQ